MVPKPLQKPHPPLWQTCHQPRVLRDGGRARRGRARHHAAHAAGVARAAVRLLPQGPRALPAGGSLRERADRGLHLRALRGVEAGRDREPRGRGRALVRERGAARLQRAALGLDHADPRRAAAERPGRERDGGRRRQRRRRRRQRSDPGDPAAQSPEGRPEARPRGGLRGARRLRVGGDRRPGPLPRRRWSAIARSGPTG